MLAAIFLGGWPVWLAALLYPFAAALLAVTVVAALYWRSSRRESGGSEYSAKTSRTPHKPRGLVQRLF
ncbi:hypothetical protein ACFMBG_08410 [Leisingera sp. D0M16]|uniref:hypothetical protein n=1 Tax=Leisingera coralii TaxID=3351347 RepID=UPI003B829D76